MKEDTVPQWLQWAREIQALSQTGLTFASSEYETQRYKRLAEIAAQIVHTNTGLTEERLLQDFDMQAGYATPKVDVRGAVIRDGQILLVQERTDELWCMPGGWADVGDLPSEMVVREVWEESGLHVVPRKVIGVYDANRSGRPLQLYHAYKVIFLCDLIGGEARPSDETSDVGFFSFDDLPPLSANRTHQRHLVEVEAHLHDPDRPAAFD
jgi:ADP-ribose pyrophosphatase YjhB (NUDIX family)